jgi:hypothetical protein
MTTSAPRPASIVGPLVMVMFASSVRSMTFIERMVAEVGLLRKGR